MSEEKSRKQVIVHIGTLKTGSTYIQNFLKINADLLAGDGIYFPLEGFQESSEPRGGRTAGHADLLEALLHEDSHGINRYRETIRQAEQTLVLFSCENFFLYPSVIPELKKLLEACEVRIIVYLRRQDHLLESLYKEFVNGGWHKLTSDIESFFSDYESENAVIQYDYFELLKPWSEAFGAESIVVRPFEPAQFYQGDLIRDFFTALEIEWNEGYSHPSSETRNQGQPAQLNKVMLDLNKIPLQGERYRAALNAFFLAYRKPLRSSGKFFATPRFRFDVASQFEASNQKLVQTYCPGRVQPLFIEPKPDPDEAHVPVVIEDPDLMSALYSEYLLRVVEEINQGISEQTTRVDFDQFLKRYENTCASIETLRHVQRTQAVVVWKKSRSQLGRRIKRLLRPEGTVIRRSGKFDEAWYRKQYLNGADENIDPIKHYVNEGVFMGYFPTEKFDSFAYIESSPNVMQSGINPFVSYLLNGQ